MRDVCGAPKLSVCVITYNHEKFIGQCLQSIIDQETDFDFEVIVGEDCSTDGTRLIVEEYANKYPKLIRAIYQPVNKNRGCNNFRSVHMAAKGEYVANFDGDDIMLPGKLQAQVHFLDANKNCSMVAHKANVISDTNSENYITPLVNQPKYSDIYRLLKKTTFFINSSKMYRRSANINSSCICNPLFMDFEINVEHASNGYIGFINQSLVCYRKHNQSTTNSSGENLYQLTNYTLRGYDKAIILGYNKNKVKYYASNYAFKSAIFYLERNDLVGLHRYLDIFCKSIDKNWKHLFMRYFFINHTEFSIEILKIRMMLKTLVREALKK